MMSIFSLRCSCCDGELSPVLGPTWGCLSCGLTFEVCGRYLLPVTATGHVLGAHDAVGTDGRARMRAGIDATE